MFDAAKPNTDSFEPIGHAIMSQWETDSSTKLIGVRSLAVQEKDDFTQTFKVIAVLETDQDHTIVPQPLPTFIRKKASS